MIYNKAHLLAEADYQGEYELREQVARYVFQSRGVHCSSEDIVIGAGTQQLLMILSALLKKQNKKNIGIENPGYFLSENIFSSQGFEICHLPLDKEGVQLSQDQTPKLDLLYVSPSHQFPTGIVMSASRRSTSSRTGRGNAVLSIFSGWRRSSKFRRIGSRLSQRRQLLDVLIIESQTVL